VCGVTAGIPLYQEMYNIYLANIERQEILVFYQ